MENFHEATSILLKRAVKIDITQAVFFTQIKAKLLRNYRQPGIIYGPIGAA